MLIAQNIVVWILTAFSISKFSKLPGEVAVNVPAAVKQHDHQVGHNKGNPDATLFNRFKLSEYALYVKELHRIFQTKACFAIAINEFLKFS
jgi:hypothetical protein